MEKKITHNGLTQALAEERREFEKFYLWLEKHMPKAFFEEFTETQLVTIVHNLMGLHLQGNFIQTHFENCSIILCLNTPDADLRILKHYTYFGIKNYQTFISDEPPPVKGAKDKLRVALIHFTGVPEKEEEASLAKELQDEVFQALHEREEELTQKEFLELLQALPNRFLRSLKKERLISVLDLFYRARVRDHVQYEIKENEDSIEITLAWRNTPKYNFLYRLAKLLSRHNLVIKRVNAVYIHPYLSENILLMFLKLEKEDLFSKDFLIELATLKYFEDEDLIESVFVTTKLLRGNLANLLRSFVSVTHQLLLPLDANFYSEANIVEGFIRHPELTVQLLETFELKFHPEKVDLPRYEQTKARLITLIDQLDTGNPTLDTRRKNVLRMGVSLVEHILKTNFYRSNKSALAFRLNPLIMDECPYERSTKFPELPFAIFFIKGKSFLGFHIRFKDLSRGGLRTIFPSRAEQAAWEKINIFSECYNLAYTQQKKNKDIPEGGAKGVIFIDSIEDLRLESQIYKKELELAGVEEGEIQARIDTYQREQRIVSLYSSQRAYVHSLLTLVNCEDDGKLKARDVVDYYQKPEYIYLGPDENMHNPMIEWIAETSKRMGYRPGAAFISSKPTYGINHKEFGVTSLGVNVYMHEALNYIGINPFTDPFTVKISGGPDGDVAGNQILNLKRFYPNTAKLLAITDVSGTIYDPEGLDFKMLEKLFREEKPIHFYNPELLHEGSLFLDLFTKRESSTYTQETLCYKKENGKLTKTWLIGNETHHIFSHNLHQTVADVFIPAGGRPRSLNALNWKDFLTPTGVPTSKIIVEGANLYLTMEARTALEEKNVLIIKDSSANKGGVICSSLEVLCGLVLSEEEFLKEKPLLMPEILAILKEKALNEARLLLSTKDQTKKPLTEISDWISKRINTFTYQILAYLETITLPTDPNHPLLQCLIHYCPPLLQKKYQNRILNNIPPIHQKAIIACSIASHTVYTKGLGWTPSIVDILPILLRF